MSPAAQGREIPLQRVWFECAPDLWMTGMVTHERRLFGRQEYRFVPDRGDARWVNVAALDFDGVVL